MVVVPSLERTRVRSTALLLTCLATSPRTSWLLASLGLASVCGRITMGALADKIGRKLSLQICLFTMSAAGFAWRYTESFTAILLFAVVYGFNAGGFPSLPPTIISDYFGDAKIGALVGLSFTADAVGVALGPPICGWIFDAAGNYDAASAFTGAMLLVSACTLFLLPDKAAHLAEMGRLDSDDDDADDTKEAGGVVVAPADDEAAVACV